jgi:hypothetical protein
VTTVCPNDQVTEMFPDHSLLVDPVDNAAWQLRVRENGHYRLLLSLENEQYDPSFSLKVPSQCEQLSSLGPTLAEDTLFLPFFRNSYWPMIPKKK